MLRLQSYDFKVINLPGKNNITDPLSRLLNVNMAQQSEFSKIAEEHVRFVAINSTPKEMTTHEVERASSDDAELQQLRTCIHSGRLTDCPDKLYATISGERYVIGQLVLRGSRIVMPRKLRPQALGSRPAVMAGRGVLTVLVVINVLVNFLNVRDVRIEPYKARLFVEREHYEKLHKDDLQCVITWLKRLTLRDISFDATAGTATSRRQRRAKRCKQSLRRPVRTSLYLATVLLLLSGDVHPNPGPPKHPGVSERHNINSNSVPELTTTSTSSTTTTTTTLSQTGLFDNAKLHKGMTIAHLNICGLEGKLEDLKLVMDGIPIDVLTLSETHLPDSVADQKLQIPGYTLYRKDRIFNPIGYGGVATYVNLSLSSDRRDTLETLDTECLWTEITLPKTRLIASVYRTPPKIESSLDALEHTFVLANETGNEIIILGDMNLDLLPNKKNGLDKKLTNLHRVLQFKQLVTKPTRVTEHSRTLIDHITTNRDNFITYTGVQSTGLSDHRMAYTVRKTTKPRHKPKQIKARTYRRFDPDAFIHDVSTAPWTNVYE